MKFAAPQGRVLSENLDQQELGTEQVESMIFHDATRIA